MACKARQPNLAVLTYMGGAMTGQVSRYLPTRSGMWERPFQAHREAH
ncbi:hypothetical protein M6B38_287540 [Iris pallida]|uniref:Uncharacterized protein n=1 Tax=Iris pallida TaxID=29817 RepID=A0AAX6HYE2_IRIPA|nr:hypothetical protein M6B38_205575 [Iris pallida]KAJ6845557.1 hypothetical protein M6B38_287540 [Iris pallida]